MFLSSLLMAQIQLGPADLPQVGDSFLTGVANDPTVIDIGTTGGNQIFDNSALTTFDTDSINFIPVAGTPGDSTFANSDMALNGDFASLFGGGLGAYGLPGFAYFSSDIASNLVFDGVTLDLNFGGYGLGVSDVSFDTDLLAYTHLDYTEVANTSANLDVPIDLDTLDNLVLRVNIDRTIEADAWGNITTPFGSFDCIRHKEVTEAEIEIGILFYGIFIPIPNPYLPDTTITSTAYSFWANNVGYPVMIANETNGAITGATYLTNPVQLVPPIANFTSVSNCLLFDFTNSSSDAQSFTWDFGDGSVSSLENPQYLYATEGYYDVTLIVSNIVGSDTVTQSIFADDCMVSTNNFEEDNFQITQNNNLINVQTNTTLIGETDYLLYNLQGNLIKSGKTSSQNFTINLEEMPSTLYVLQLINRENEIIQQKRIVKFW